MHSLAERIGALATPWAYVVVFALTLGESAAFVGLFVPGETALLVGGFLAYQGRAQLWVMVAAAVLGGIIGDSVGYEIGRHLGPAIRRSWLGRRVGEERWERAENYLERRGGRSVFLGRWIGIMRALVPGVAGTVRMPYRRFLFWNVLGAVTWAPTVVVAGYLAGGSWRVVERWAGRASWIALAAVVVGVVGFTQVRKRRGGTGEAGEESAAST